MNHKELRTKALSRPNTKKEYDLLGAEYDLARRMLAARKRAGLTQSDVAKRMGTKTPSIARLERSLLTGAHSPSLETIRKYATAVDCRLEVKLSKRRPVKRAQSVPVRK